MKPFIAVVANFTENVFNRPCSMVPFAYTSSIEKGGGIPFIIPLTCSCDVIRSSLSRADGVLFTGGPDICPKRYGEEPDESPLQINPVLDEPQFTVCKEALELDLPLLGICRGAQVINVALGGSLVQDVPTCFPESELNHMDDDPERFFYPCHDINIKPGSALHKIFGDRVCVNSVHHQAIKKPGNGLQVIARSEDGIVEATEHESKPILCVQWHPELMLIKNNDMLPLFKHFIQMCSNPVNKR